MVINCLMNFLKPHSINVFQSSWLSFKASKLINRKLITLKGPDSFKYIQGMVTNDVRLLYPNLYNHKNHYCIFTFLLNSSGRVVADLFIYNLNLNETFHESDKVKQGDKSDFLLLECDDFLADKIIHHLKIHKVRSKVDISINCYYQPWSIYPNIESSEFIFPFSNTSTFLNFNQRFLATDPRLPLHYRYLALKEDNFEQIKDSLSHHLNGTIEEANLESYIFHRYSLGIGEGIKDHPFGNCFVFECNADFLHGLSLKKGCYIGQELTARVFYTGVIRKRLMPINILNYNDKKIDQIKENSIITSLEGNKFGKFRNHVGSKGLGLIYVEKVVKNKGKVIGQIKLDNSQIKIEAFKPFWWPKEILVRSG